MIYIQYLEIIKKFDNNQSTLLKTNYYKSKRELMNTFLNITPPIVNKMELDNLMSTQKGGASLQQVKKFTPFKEEEYFTTDTFKKILKQMNE